MNFALALAIAVNFWSVRGVEIPCTPTPVVGAHLALDPAVTIVPWQIPMASDVAKCQILISSSGAAARKAAPNDYCAYVTHEVGHIAGQAHAPKGIMAETLGSADNPWYCDNYRVFARRLSAQRRSRGRASESKPSPCRACSRTPPAA